MHTHSDIRDSASARTTVSAIIQEFSRKTDYHIEQILLDQFAPDRLFHSSPEKNAVRIAFGIVIIPLGKGKRRLPSSHLLYIKLFHVILFLEKPMSYCQLRNSFWRV